MNIKTIISKKLIIITILVASLIGNAYYFGGAWLKKDRQANFNAGVITVFQTAQQNGQVQMTLDGQLIKLIKE